VGIEENQLGLQNRLNPLLAHILNHAIPVRTRLNHALMHLDHRRVLLDRVRQHAARLLASLQFGIRL
jgi:hypothetical protein